MDQESNLSNRYSLQITGVSSFNKAATLPLRALSSVFDSIFMLLIFISCLSFLKAPPIPCPLTLILFISIPILYVFLQKKVVGVTIGERIWHLKMVRGPTGVNELRQQDYFELKEWLKSVVFTAIFGIISLFSVNQVILRNPVWQPTSYWGMKAFVPPLEKEAANQSTQKPESTSKDHPSNDQWQIMPIFYHIGTLPLVFRSQPIYYSLPYSYGPPKKFVGRMILHLQDPDTQLIIEGPKTPDKSASREIIKDCFLQNSYSYTCLTQRYKILSRHIYEIQATHPASTFALRSTDHLSWQVTWFQVENPSLSEEDQAQGVYLRASAPTHTPDLTATSNNSAFQWIQDRFILINAKGTQQTLILNRAGSAVGNEGFDLTLKTIGSLRGFTDLDAGKAWINRELESIRLDDLKSTQDPRNLLANLVQIQSLLISKISVDPASFDSYFHLAGTSLLLLSSLKDHPEIPIGPRRSSAMSNLFSSYLFARDILPEDSRNAQLEQMIAQGKKFLSSESLQND